MYGVRIILTAAAAAIVASPALAQQPSDDECLSKALSIFASAPSPAPDLMDYLMEYAQNPRNDLKNPTDVCAVTADMPASLSSEYASYTSAAAEWFSSTASSDLMAIPTLCATSKEDQEALGIQISSALAVSGGIGCAANGAAATTTAGSSTPAASSGTTASGADASATTSAEMSTITKAPTSASGSGSSPASTSASGSVSQAAAPRETGLVAGALAAAGFLGAVAML